MRYSFLRDIFAKTDDIPSLREPPKLGKLASGNLYCGLDKQKRTFGRQKFFFVGAGDRGRTDTVSLPLDFESSTSANSITPAFFTALTF